MELLVENVLNIGADEFYRSTRYKTPLVVILVNSEDKNAFNILDENVRQTDVVQQLSSDLLVIFLSHTDYERASKHIKKLTEMFDFTYTMGEFEGFELDFIKNLFKENFPNIDL